MFHVYAMKGLTCVTLPLVTVRPAVTILLAGNVKYVIQDTMETLTPLVEAANVRNPLPVYCNNQSGNNCIVSFS